MKHAALLLLAFLLAGCGSASSDDPGLEVVATTSILGDLTGRLVGSDGNVEVLIGPGADPHAFSLTPSQTARLQSADLVVANGLGLEGDIEDALEAAAAEGAVVVELAEQVDPLPFEHPGDDPGEPDHEHGDLDPHFVLDPLRMADAADVMAAALADIDASIDWYGRAAEVRSELETLHRDIEEELSVIPAERRKLVTNHEALGYFAHRYGFEIVGTVIPGGSTMAEPSASDLAELVETLRNEGVDAIFTETGASSTLAETVAAELGEEVEVHELHTESLGEPGSGAETYAGMMRTNASIIASALGD